jgi:hypothetical protein
MFGLRSLRDLPALSEVAVPGEEHGTPMAEAVARGGGGPSEYRPENEAGPGDDGGAKGLDERS